MLNARVSPLHPIPVDVLFRNVCCHLRIRDLGRLMRVNRLFFETFITDNAWQHFYSRLVAAMPDLRAHVFEKYPWHSAGEMSGERDTKRAKLAPNKGKANSRAFIVPRGGVWYVMRNFIIPSISIDGLKKLCTFTTKPNIRTALDVSYWTLRDQTVQYLLAIVFAGVIPAKLNPQRIGVAKIKPHQIVWFTVDLRMGNANANIALYHGDDNFLWFIHPKGMNTLYHTENENVVFQPLNLLLSPTKHRFLRREHFEKYIEDACK